MSDLRAYATLAQYHARRGTKAADQIDPLNGKLLAKLRIATNKIDQRTRRSFQPEQAARKFDYIDTSCVNFAPYELLSLTSVTDGNGLSVPTANIALLGTLTYWGFELDSKATRLTYNTTRIKAITVTGIWGYHDDYANAWHNTGITVNTDGGGTSITTSANNGADAWGQTPALSAGQLIQVESEWMQVIAVPSATTITVVRAQNGTSQATHANGTAISVYEAPMDARELCLRWAAYLEAQDSNDFDKTTITPLGGKMVAPGLPSDIEDACELLARQPI